MIYDPQKHHRRSIRLKGYDYTHPGAYFFTICTRERECLLGRVENRTMVLSKYGRLVERCWCSIPRHFPHVELDAFVVMPNHVHGIIIMKGEAFDAKNKGRERIRHQTGTRFINPKAECFAPTTTDQQSQPPHGAQSGSLGAILQNFKSVSTRKINRVRAIRGVPLWQRNYYERIIRNEDALNRIRCYIRENPAQWETDQNNPIHQIRT